MINNDLIYWTVSQNCPYTIIFIFRANDITISKQMADRATMEYNRPKTPLQTVNAVLHKTLGNLVTVRGTVTSVSFSLLILKTFSLKIHLSHVPSKSY